MEDIPVDIPQAVRRSVSAVMAHAEFVSIDERALSELAVAVKGRFKQGFDSVDDAFGSTGDLERDINLVYFETAMNFCFWAQDPSVRWMVEYDGVSNGGWYGLRNAFARALADNVPVYDAAFMADMTFAQAAELLRGVNGTTIPLLEQRVNNCVEAARFLLQEHDGSAHQFIKSCGHDSPRIAAELVTALPSYRDGAMYHERWVWLCKRAQIFPSDVAQLSQKYSDFQLHGVDRLTAFADYRLPQVLRHYGVLKYAPSLATLIDGRKIIPSGSAEEIEIRAATIALVDQLAERCGMSVADVDVSLWLMSQDMRDDPALSPHHITVSYFY